MRTLEFTQDGKTYRVLIDGKAVVVRNTSDLKALTLDVRDRDRRFYDSLMQAEEFRRIHEHSGADNKLLNMIEILMLMWRRHKNGG